MSAIKTKHEHKTILDLSGSKLSRHRVRRLIRETEFLEWDNGRSIYIENNIKVGMYTIHLNLINTQFSKPAQHLKDYGNFTVLINENGRHGSTIKLNRDDRFRNQYWIPINDSFQLKCKHLVDIILHCQRLDSLKAFL